MVVSGRRAETTLGMTAIMAWAVVEQSDKREGEWCRKR